MKVYEKIVEVMQESLYSVNILILDDKLLMSRIIIILIVLTVGGMLIALALNLYQVE